MGDWREERTRKKRGEEQKERRRNRRSRGWTKRQEER
jgi:hypothetical protein